MAMTSRVFATSTAPLPAGACRLMPGGTEVPAGAVVLARDADVEALAVGPETAGVWVVLGEGEMPPGFQPFLVLSADAGDALIDRALAARDRAEV